MTKYTCTICLTIGTFEYLKTVNSTNLALCQVRFNMMKMPILTFNVHSQYIKLAGGAILQSRSMFMDDEYTTLVDIVHATSVSDTAT